MNKQHSKTIANYLTTFDQEANCRSLLHMLIECNLDQCLINVAVEMGGCVPGVEPRGVRGSEDCQAVVQEDMDTRHYAL
jgi:hypothetical protein